MQWAKMNTAKMKSRTVEEKHAIISVHTTKSRRTREQKPEFASDFIWLLFQH